MGWVFGFLALELANGERERATTLAAELAGPQGFVICARHSASFPFSTSRICN